MANIQPDGSQELETQESTWSDASKLSRKVRELAHRAHRAMRPPTRSQASADPVGDDPSDLRNQVARLQRKIHQRQLRALVPWVDALRRQVDARLEKDEEARRR
jgi:hypothetical protein